MKGDLIKTNTIWYKIRKFFKSLFIRKQTEEQDTINLKENKDFFNNISFENEIKECNRKDLIAKKLLTEELVIDDLTDEETDEMIDYFNKDIKKMDSELTRIKAHIIDMRKELYNK